MAEKVTLPNFDVFLRALDPETATDTDSDSESATDIDTLLAHLDDSDLDYTNIHTPQREYDEILEDIKNSVTDYIKEDDFSDISSPPRPEDSNHINSDTDCDSKPVKQLVIEPDNSERTYIWHNSTPEDYEGKPPTSLLDVTPPMSPGKPLTDHCDTAIRKLLLCNPSVSIHFDDATDSDVQPSSDESSPSPPHPDCGPAPQLFATFSNVPTLFVPYHPVSYIVHISVYPKSASGTLYERIGGNVCARSTLCDEQVFMVYRLDEKKGLDFVVRYLTSSLLVNVVMHNEVFKYKIDFRRIPIKVFTYDGKSLEYTY